MAQKLYDWGDGRGKVHTRAKKTVAEAPAGNPLRPPPGSYDPSIDAQERATGRGLSDLIGDTYRGNERATSDFTLGMGDIGRQRADLQADYQRATARGSEDYGENVSDLERDYGRGQADLLTNRAQTGEDYQKSLSDLTRQYTRLANNQGQQARQRGVTTREGGFAAQAARKRAENQGLDRAPLDTNFNRAMQASQLSESRLSEDRGESLSDLLRGHQRDTDDRDWSLARNNQALDRGGGDLGIGYQRGYEDRQTALDRAGREAQEFTQDAAAARQASARTPVVTTANTVDPKYTTKGSDGKYLWPDGKRHSTPYKGR